PSHWESFGLVCCEGMAAARAVVGSAAGGMAEILGGGEFGMLVEPRQPRRLVEVLVSLLTNDARRHALGERARQRVLEYYSPSRVIPLQIESYRRAIARAGGER